MYLTDGEHLYEIVGEDIHRNHGCGSSLIRSIALEDCATGDRHVLSGERIAELDVINETS